MKQYPPLITAPLDKPITEDKLLPCGNWKLKANGDGTGILKPVKSLNVDFDGVTPGADQLIHDGMNQQAIEKGCLTSQCLTDKGREALLNSKYPYKLTDMHGGKGVICEVWPEDQMPKTLDGKLPDIMIHDYPVSPFRRPDSDNWLNRIPRDKK